MYLVKLGRKEFWLLGVKHLGIQFLREMWMSVNTIHIPIARRKISLGRSSHQITTVIDHESFMTIQIIYASVTGIA